MESNIKIKQIKIQNLGPIEELEVDLNGKSFWVVASNGKGKSTFIESFCRVMTSTMPKDIIKEGADAGMCQFVMDDGTILKWTQNKGKDSKVVIHHTDGKKETATQKLLNKLFGDRFDLNSFLTATDAEKVKIISKIFNQDLSEINEKIKTAEEERAACSRDLKKAEANRKKVDVSWSKKEILDASLIVKERDDLKKQKDEREKLEKDIKITEDSIEQLKKESLENIEEIQVLETEIANLHECKCNYSKWYLDAVEKFGDKQIAEKFITVAKNVLDESANLVELYNKERESIENKQKNNTTLLQSLENGLPTAKETLEAMPTDFSKIKTLDDQLETLTDYNAKVQEAKEAQKTVDEYLKCNEAYEKATEKVEELRDQKLKIIKENPIPVEGLAASEDSKDLEFNGIKFSSLAKSQQVIIAAKLCIALQKIPIIGIDASPLDKQNTIEFLNWCNENDIQVGIEKPCWEDEPKELKIELIN